MTLNEIYAALDSTMPATVDGATLLTGAATDNRNVKSGDIFFCIRGERADGHDFAVNAVASGAACVVGERPLPEITSVPVIVVENTVTALGRIAHAWREKFPGTLVVVTGSAGKTTVKEVLAHVLGQHASTAKNALNLNNQIGMPLSLLNCTGEERYWVMEAGISHAHDMDELGTILRPDVGLVLNVGGAHAEGLGARGVAWHKAHLLSYVREGGLGFACADYDDLAVEAGRAMPDVRLFSVHEGRAPLYATYLGSNPASLGLYTLHLDGRDCQVEAPFRGAYGAENAIAIAAVASALGVTDSELQRGFATAALPRQRFQVRMKGAWIVVDDCYNANPLSMRRMLESVQELAQGRPLVTVMGAMGELGSTATAEHYLLGQRLAQAGVAMVVWRGDFADEVEDGLRDAGSRVPFCRVNTVGEFAALWRGQRPTGGIVLCKGSRSNTLEEFVDIMCGCEEDSHVL